MTSFFGPFSCFFLALIIPLPPRVCRFPFSSPSPSASPPPPPPPLPPPASPAPESSLTVNLPRASGAFFSAHSLHLSAAGQYSQYSTGMEHSPQYKTFNGYLTSAFGPVHHPFTSAAASGSPLSLDIIQIYIFLISLTFTKFFRYFDPNFTLN